MRKIVRKLYKNIQRLIGKKTKIGNFTLNVDPENSQPYIIKKYPEHGKNLITLAKVTSSKYENLNIIDIGANFGDTAAMLLTDNPEYKVFCIEGDKESFKLLFSNFGINKNVELHQVFLGSHDGKVDLSFSKVGGSLRLTKNNPKKNEVEILTLDSLIARQPSLSLVKLLKIDTDGYDNKILSGSKNFLMQNKPVVFFEYDKKYLTDMGEIGLDVFDLLEECGYKHLVFFDNYGRFLISLDIQNKKNIIQLDRYIKNYKGAIPYYDIAAFSATDSDIADTFINKEENQS